MKKTVLSVNIAEFLAEFFMNRTGEKVQFSYGLFWDAFHEDYGTPESINGPDEDSNLYYVYGLLKAEEEIEGDHKITEIWLDNCSMWSYELKYYNANGILLSIWFYTRTRIMAFIQYENETLEVAWEMQEITKHKPVLCLESRTVLFRGALDCILEAYSKDEYSEEELQREYCPDSNEVADAMKRWNFYKPGCSDSYAAYMEMVGNTVGGNVGHAIDAAWTWFRTGYVNNFISLNPHTKEINLNW